MSDIWKRPIGGRKSLIERRNNSKEIFVVTEYGNAHLWYNVRSYERKIKFQGSWFKTVLQIVMINIPVTVI